MKGLLIRALLFLVGIAVGVSGLMAVRILNDDGDGRAVATASARGPVLSLKADATNAELVDYAYTLLGYVKSGDMSALSLTVHPVKGLVFSPYAAVNLTTNKCFTAAQVAGFGTDGNQYVWGIYDGSGSPISLTPQEYFKKFVFDKDYTRAAEIGVDTVVKAGNALENIRDVFPNCRFVDFHILGTTEGAGGLDWSSLRLGFEKFNDELRLTAIVHSQWTV